MRHEHNKNSTMEKPKAKVIKRQRHSASKVLAIARKALLPGSTIASVAYGHGLAESTVQGWVKRIKELEALDEGVHGGLKAIHPDKAPTLTKGLNAFCEDARRAIPPLPITVECLCIQAKSLPQRLLSEHEKNPTIISSAEADALKKLSFARTWACKWLQCNNYIR